MSWGLMLATRHWEVSPIARHVGTIIAGHANRGGLAWQPGDHLPRRPGWSRRAVMRAVRELTADGYFTVVARNRCRASQYVFAGLSTDSPRSLPAIGGGPTVTDPGRNSLRPWPERLTEEQRKTM